MTFFSRMMKSGRQYDGKFTQPQKAAPPAHLRDKNKSHTGQGSKATTVEPPATSDAPCTDK